jgi:hypothetical protein
MSVAATRLGVQQPRPSRAPARSEQARLEVVERRAGASRRRRLAPALGAAMVAGSLLTVVLGHALLAQDQVRLAAVEAAITAAEVAHRSDVVQVANLSNPARILREAQSALQMAAPGQVQQLPYVTLRTPLPDPNVGPPNSASSATAGHP